MLCPSMLPGPDGQWSSRHQIQVRAYLSTRPLSLRMLGKSRPYDAERTNDTSRSTQGSEVHGYRATRYLFALRRQASSTYQASLSSGSPICLSRLSVRPGASADAVGTNCVSPARPACAVERLPMAARGRHQPAQRGYEPLSLVGTSGPRASAKAPPPLPGPRAPRAANSTPSSRMTPAPRPRVPPSARVRSASRHDAIRSNTCSLCQRSSAESGRSLRRPGSAIG